MPSTKNPSSRRPPTRITVPGLDLAQYEIHLIGMNADGRVVLRLHLTEPSYG